MKKIEINKEYSRNMTPNEMLICAQRIYDDKNWYGKVSTKDEVLLIACKMGYKEQTGKDLPLEYNCPA